MNSWEKSPAIENGENKFEPKEAIGDEMRSFERRSGRKRKWAGILALASLISVGAAAARQETGQGNAGEGDDRASSQVEKNRRPAGEAQRAYRMPEVAKTAENTEAGTGAERQAAAPETKENITASSRWVDAIVAKAKAEADDLKTPDDVEAYARTLASDLRSEIEFPN